MTLFSISMFSQLHVRSFFYYFIKLLTGGVFILSGILKFTSAEIAVNGIETALRFSNENATLLIYGISALEIIFGSLLFAKPKITLWASLVLTAILVCFTIFGTLFQDSLSSCGCFGSLYQERFGLTSIIRNSVLIALLLFLHTSTVKRFTIQRKFTIHSSLSAYLFFIHVVVFFLFLQALVSNQNHSEEPLVTTREFKELRKGDSFPLEHLTVLQGDGEILHFNKLKLLFIFSVQCSHCKTTLPVWKSLYTAFDSTAITTIGLSVSSHEATQRYVKENTIQCNIVLPENLKTFVSSHNIFSTPILVLLNGKNNIAHVWYGELSQNRFNEIRNKIESIAEQEYSLTNKIH